MATRFYFSTTDPGITPSYDGGWDYTDASDRRKMFESKQSTGSVYVNDFETDASPVHCCLRQFVSNKQYNGRTFLTSETWKFQARATESDAAANAYISIVAKVISSDGSTVRGTIINSFNDDTEIDDVAYENRSLSGNISNQVTMQDGDRILLEVGIYFNNTTESSMGAEVPFEDTPSSDLPENDTETGFYAPWFELSATLAEYSGTADKLSDDAESKLLAHVFKNTEYTQPSNIYVALCKSTIDDVDTGSTLPSELSGGSYARKLCNTWDTDSVVGEASNDVAITFAKATAPWGIATDFAICDALSGGNVICYGKFTTARNIGSGDQFIINTNDLDVTWD